MAPTIKELRSTCRICFIVRFTLRADRYTEILVVNCVLCGFGLLVTIIRLGIQYHRQKLWWDDFWIVAAGICTAVLMVTNFYHTADPGKFNRVYYLYRLCILMRSP